MTFSCWDPIPTQPREEQLACHTRRPWVKSPSQKTLGRVRPLASPSPILPDPVNNQPSPSPRCALLRPAKIFFPLPYPDLLTHSVFGKCGLSRHITGAPWVDQARKLLPLLPFCEKNFPAGTRPKPLASLGPRPKSREIRGIGRERSLLRWTSGYIGTICA